MKLSAMLTELRTSRLDDTVYPYFWSDDELIGFLNDGVRQVCLRQRCFSESQNDDLCTIPISATQQLVQLHPAVLAVRSVRYIDPTNTQCEHTLKPTTARNLWEIEPRWDIDDPGLPEWWVPDYQEGMLAISRRPENPGYLKLVVWREALECEQLKASAPDGEPVIPRQWHINLMDWAEHRAFQHPDAEKNDPARALSADARFTAAVGRLPSANEVRLWAVSRLRQQRRAQFL